MKKILRDALVPHSDNNYLPTLLRRVAMGSMGVLVVLTFCIANMQALLWQASDWLVGAVLPGVVIDYTNEERETLALAPLVRNSVLDEAARRKATHMAEHSYFAHYSPDGVSPWVWFEQVGYVYAHAGENLAVHFSDSDEVVEAWMESPTHRANIVNGNYQEIGVGTAKGVYQGYPTVFVVQLFGTPGVAPVAAGLPVSATPPAAIAVRPEPLPAPLAVTNEPVSVRTDSDAVVAAEAVAGVETFEQAPVAEPVVEAAPATAVSESVIVPAVPPVQVAETNVTADLVSLYSETVATSTDLVPAPVVVAAPTPDASLFGVLATSPRTFLHTLYLMVGTLLALALLLSVVLEWRQQHFRQVGYGVGLLCLMSALFYVHSLVTSGAVIQ